MSRAILSWAAAIMLLAGAFLPASAQDLRALARVDLGVSRLAVEGETVDLVLGLSQPVPYRIETRLNPMRLVVEFREVDFSGAEIADLLADGAARDLVMGLRAGPVREGWSQLELLLAQPMALETANLHGDEGVGSALLELRLSRTDEPSFLASAARGDLGVATAPVVAAAPDASGHTRQRGDRPLIVMLDPGHGGFDPGAERDGYTEADLMLQFARELQDHLVREAGYTVLLTRTEDEFVPLPERVARARAAGADLFLSLHADALISGNASGARVYTLSEIASDDASARLAEQLDRASLLAGMDLTAQDDTVAEALMDLARAEVRPRSDRLANELVAGITQTVGEMHRRPRLFADFSVLRAPDIPSALIELGFLSSDEDLERLLSAEWRAQLSEGIRIALQAWAIGDAAEADLVRQ